MTKHLPQQKLACQQVGVFAPWPPPASADLFGSLLLRNCSVLLLTCWACFGSQMVPLWSRPPLLPPPLSSSQGALLPGSPANSARSEAASGDRNNPNIVLLPVGSYSRNTSFYYYYYLFYYLYYYCKASFTAPPEK